MASAFKYLTSVLFAAIVVQVALAGYGVFYALHAAKHGQPPTLKTFDHGFAAHAAVGVVIAVVVILLALLATLGRLGPAAVRMSGALLVLTGLQFPFAEIGKAVAAVGLLHDG